MTTCFVFAKDSIMLATYYSDTKIPTCNLSQTVIQLVSVALKIKSLIFTCTTNCVTHWIKSLDIIGGQIDNMTHWELSNRSLTKRQYLYIQSAENIPSVKQLCCFDYNSGITTLQMLVSRIAFPIAMPAVTHISRNFYLCMCAVFEVDDWLMV